ncbi:hypothetical protein [Nostoc punctiforme]|uniref:hypothetical protein n=1 Tax=Nostoc punctiforme TaxID=272131 RepID=UPI001F557931|nr:hypothetical protein [Nostoc punctiforme]
MRIRDWGKLSSSLIKTIFRRIIIPVEFIGLIRTKPALELNSVPGSLADDIIDPGYVREFAQAHEKGDFDKVLIGYSSSSPDGFSVATHAATFPDRLGFLIAHRPGFVAPTLLGVVLSSKILRRREAACR